MCGDPGLLYVLCARTNVCHHLKFADKLLKQQQQQRGAWTGSVTSSDSGHGSCVQADTHSNCSENGSGANNVGGLYHVASSIVHNSPSPTLQQRRHSNIHGKCSFCVRLFEREKARECV